MPCMSNSTNQRTPQETGKFQQSSTQRNGKNSTSTSRPHGKSKFAQKSRGKAKAPVAVKRGPVLQYTSVCCSMPATKPACVKVDKKKALEQGLGSWRCTGCHKAAKVTVSKAKPAEYPKESLKVLEGIPVPQRPEAFVPEVPVG